MYMTPISPVPNQWRTLVDLWLDSLRARGLRPASVSTRRRHIGFFLRSNPGLAPQHCTVSTVLAWAGQQEWAPETRKSYYASLRSFLRWLELNGFDIVQGQESVLPRVPRPRPAPRPMPRHLRDTLYCDRDPRVALAARFAGQAGLRRHEIAVVHDDDFLDDLLGRSLRVHGKGDKQRIVPLSDDLDRAIKAYRQQLDIPPGWLFPGHVDGHISDTWLGKLVNQRLPKPWSLHCLRHRFASDLYQHTGNVILVRDLLGHESVATTQRYLAIPPDHARRAVNMIAA